MNDPFTTYLKELQRNLAAGNATEHTHRPALKNLVESLGTKIIATNEPARIECGSPDYIVTKGELPLGYIEAKDVGKSLDEAEKSEQVQRYLNSLGNVMLTDYLEFRWYVSGERRAEARLATVSRDGKLKRQPQGVEDVRESLASFLEYQAEGVGTPKELALRLARLTHLIRDSTIAALEKEPERGNLHELWMAFRDVLVPDLTAAQFADMYAQTIAYGLFAARCTNPFGAQDKSTMGRFTRQVARDLIPRTNPFLRKLFDRVAGAELDDRIAWLVDDLAELLDRADMAAVLQDFGRRTKKEDPVVHFYETFLAAYDPKVREMRGVYYTPEPVVSYIIRSIDYLLKSRFQRPLGLADPQVLILDPALGTGTFLYSVVNEIEAALTQQGQRGAWNDYVAEKLLPRLFGFELLMAPYAVAHLKLGLLLQETGYRFQSDQRLGIYLTNTLEGAIKKSEILLAQYIAEEANAANEIKKEKPIMVVLGNPPYSGHSANRAWEIKEEVRGNRLIKRKEKTFIGQLIEDYKVVDGQPVRERVLKWLQDDYVKFIRWGQWRIERTGCGVLGFITNHGYLDNPTFRGVRQQLMRAFNEIYILNLHGNVKKKERAPDGSKDENVFDIQQGVAIGIFIKEPNKTAPAKVYYADLWGLEKSKSQILSRSDLESTQWRQLEPGPPFYLFVPRDIELLTEFERGWKVTDMMPRTLLGPNSHRDRFAIAFTYDSAAQRIRDLADKRLEDSALREKYGIADTRDWSLEDARGTDFTGVSPVLCLYRPFDFRYMLYGAFAFDYHRPEVNDHMLVSNIGLISTRQTKEPFGVYVTGKPVGQHKLATPYDGSYLSPLYLYMLTEERKGRQERLLEASPWLPGKGGRVPNLNRKFIAELGERLGLEFIPDGRGDLKETFGPEDVFNYAYAVFHSPTYRSRYAEFLKSDFPRLPLTSDRALFAGLAARGAELVALHLIESAALGKLITRYPVSGSNLVERVDYVDKPPVAQASSLCSDTGKMPVPPGLPCLNRVYINKEQYFEGVPPDVWQFHIGGYQVCQKWLKDRKGRRLSYDEVTHYQKIIVALEETIRLMAEIDSLIPAWPLA